MTIWAENAGGRTTRLLRALPSFSGSWRGTYAVARCESSGQWRSLIEFCDSFRVGEVLEIGLDMSQTDDRVTAGSFTLGGLPPGSFTPAAVSESGVLSITGRATPDPAFSISLENTGFESVTAGSMTGRFEQLWASPSLTGSGRVLCDVRTVARTGGGPAFGPSMLGSPLTLREAIQRVRGR